MDDKEIEAMNDAAMLLVEAFCDRHGFLGAGSLLAAVTEWASFNGHSKDLKAAIASLVPLLLAMDAEFSGTTRQ